MNSRRRYRGRITIKVVEPLSLLTETVPPWSSTTRFTMARPTPFPSAPWDSSA